MAAAVTMKRVDLFITDFYFWVSEHRRGPALYRPPRCRIRATTGGIIPRMPDISTENEFSGAGATRSSQDPVHQFPARPEEGEVSEEMAHELDVHIVATPCRVRGYEAVGRGPEGAPRGQRLGDHDVEVGGADPPRLQPLDERVLVDRRAPAHVVEPGARLEARDPAGVDVVPGRVVLGQHV